MSDERPTDPHPSPNEDPEHDVGWVINDPWDDPDQTDWPTEYVDPVTGQVSD
jgi:hypothetical protein